MLTLHCSQSLKTVSLHIWIIVGRRREMLSLHEDSWKQTHTLTFFLRYLSQIVLLEFHIFIYSHTNLTMYIRYTDILKHKIEKKTFVIVAHFIDITYHSCTF